MISSFLLGVFLRLRSNKSEKEYQSGNNFFHLDPRGSRYEITLFFHKKQYFFKLESDFYI